MWAVFRTEPLEEPVDANTEIVNADQAEAWGGEEGQHWVGYADAYDAMSAPFNEGLLGAAAVAAADQVLDVGCGCGATTLDAARRARDGFVVGIDLSAPMLTVAGRRARDLGLTNVAFVCGDAQVHPLEPARRDVAISRFGVMFFADPVVAFANIGRSLKPGGRIAFLCWQEMLANEWVALPGMALATHVPLPDLGEAGGPGPFSLAEPARIEAVLESAGFSDTRVEERRAPMKLPGSTPGEFERFLRELPVVRHILADAEPETAERAIGAVLEVLEPRFGPEGLYLEGASWLVTASRRAVPIAG
jgi:SAM-dependent methyltransferase